MQQFFQPCLLLLNARFGLVFLRLQLGNVEPDKRLASGDFLTFFDQHGFDASADFRSDANFARFNRA